VAQAVKEMKTCHSSDAKKTANTLDKSMCQSDLALFFLY